MGLHKIQFKKRAPRAIREIRKFTAKVMSTTDVRIDTKLNKAIWPVVCVMLLHASVSVCRGSVMRMKMLSRRCSHSCNTCQWKASKICRLRTSRMIEVKEPVPVIGHDTIHILRELYGR